MSNQLQVSPRFTMKTPSNKLLSRQQHAAFVAEVQGQVDAIRALPPTDDENEKRARVKSRKAITALLHIKA